MAESLLSTLSKGSAEWYRQKAYEDGERDWNSSMYGSKMEGIAIGAQQNARENARNLLKKSTLPPEMIADCCSLPLAEVLALKEQLAHEAAPAQA